MNTTYTAWDGEERPWPPPENWYRAADGRWWHPAHGPEEATGDQPKSLPVWDFTDSTDLVDAGDWTLADVSDDPGVRGSDLEPRAETPTEDVSAVHHDVQSDLGAGTGVDTESSEPARWRWAVVAMVVVLGLAVAAQVFLGGTDTDVSTATNPDSAEANSEGGDADTSESEPVIEDDSATASTSTIAGSPADGEAAERDDSPDEAATDPQVAATVADFRRQLSEHDLATDDLTDDQITTFASTYCVYAGAAEDLAAFDELRQVAVTGSRSNLTPTQLNITINTAILVFCPVEADRLGITDATSP